MGVVIFIGLPGAGKSTFYRERFFAAHLRINFNDLPLWQKRGVGLYWEEYDRPAVNPVTGENVLARRRRIRRDLDLPMKDDYSAFLRNLIVDSRREG